VALRVLRKNCFQAIREGRNRVARLTLTGKTITLPQGVTNIRSHEVLQDLFGEVLAQLPELRALLLVEAFFAGKVIRVSMVQNSRGKKPRMAFQWIVD